MSALDHNHEGGETIWRTRWDYSCTAANGMNGITNHNIVNIFRTVLGAVWKTVLDTDCGMQHFRTHSKLAKECLVIIHIAEIQHHSDLVSFHL